MSSEPRQGYGITAGPIDGSTMTWALRALGGRESDLTAQELANMNDTLLRVDVRAGVEIVRAGEPATHVFLIRSGAVELQRPYDPRHGVLSCLESGGVFGDVPVLLGRPHHLDAIASSDTELLAMRSQDLLRLIDVIPALASRWLWSLADRVLETHQRLDEMLAGHLDYRVAAFLTRRACTDGRVEITQDQLARHFGVQRSSVNETIKRLDQRGFLRKGYGYIQVIEPQRLAALLRL